MYPLELRIQLGNWRVFAARKASRNYAKFSERVFRRDNYTCQFCGFQARDFQEIINLDQNYSNNVIHNLVTACCFCAQCFFLESVGVSYGGGTLIYLPELSQAYLNSFCHVVFCSISNETTYKDVSQNSYRSLKFRSKPVDEIYGEGMSEPATFAQMIIDVCEDDLSITQNLLKDLRLLPSRARFKTQIDRWAQTALQEFDANI